jgi:coenzyme F420-0:L-glutamate ligase/coenzyme F420-1:gamma-L-glutamate ligase
VENIPEVQPGADLPSIFLETMNAMGEDILSHDIVVIAQKIVSKSEDRRVSLNDVSPSEEARELASEVGKDPRLVELILSESTEIVRKRDGLIIARHRNGCVVANAGIDLSNSGAEETAILLPVDADQSAKNIGDGIRSLSGKKIAVVINDSMGRAWRMGTSGTAIGAFGLSALDDRRGTKDRDGTVLQSSEIAVADEVAAAASLIMGQGNESLPIIIVRGLSRLAGFGRAADLVRPPAVDLFR